MTLKTKQNELRDAWSWDKNVIFTGDKVKQGIDSENISHFICFNFLKKLRCLVCQEPLKGQKEAQEHAEKTKHINFGEY